MTPYQFLKAGAADDTSSPVKFTRGILDTHAAPTVGEELSRLAAASCRRALLLDLGNVSFLTAAVLGRLVALHVELRSSGGGLALCNVPPLVYGAFEATRLTNVFDIRPAPARGILIVEDDDTVRAALKTLLEGEGYSVACAADGREALDRLRQAEPPALILLDLVMGGMDGWQFRREQELDPALAAIPVVVVSATADLARSAASLGAAGYLHKPVGFEDLVEAVRQHV